MRRDLVGLLVMISAASPSRPVRAWSHELDQPARWQSEVRYELRPPSSYALRVALHEELRRAISAWGGAPCTGPRVRLVGNTTRAPDVMPEGADGHSVIGFEERAWKYGTGVLAVTRLRARDGVFSEADILLNAVDYEWRIEPVPTGSRRLRQLAPTLLHELGHVWGLGHSTDADAAMNGSALHLQPGPDDFEGICSLYPRVEQRTLPTAEHGNGDGWWIAVLLAIGAGALWRLRRAKRQ